MFLSLSDILSVAIGLIFIFLLLSMLTSYVMELISSIFEMRSKNLVDAVQLLFDPSSNQLNGVKKLRQEWSDGKEIWDKGIVGEAETVFRENIANKLNENFLKAFYSHPIIASLTRPNKLPSYIPSKVFGVVLFDLLSKAGTVEVTKPEEFLAGIKSGIQTLNNNSLKMAILPLVENADLFEQEVEKKIAQARNNVENWFNSTMERSSGWYKRRVQWIAVVCSILIAVILNADTIGITQSLWRDTSLRQSIANAAQSYIQNGNQTKADQTLQSLNEINLPLGWNGKVADLNPQTPINSQEIPTLPSEIFLKVIGLLITGLAISQGSTIWFDLLKDIINIRSTGSKPEVVENKSK
jgi:hypothetical protein